MEDPDHIILGIDPGTKITGYGIISVKNRSTQLIDYGCIRPPANGSSAQRYLAIFEAIDYLLSKHLPQAVAVETQFLSRNFQSALKVGMARGVAMVAAARQKVPVFEYSPSKAKLAVVGNGRASKQQVQAMIKLLLNLSVLPQPEDAADALALAICHAHTLK